MCQLPGLNNTMKPHLSTPMLGLFAATGAITLTAIGWFWLEAYWGWGLCSALLVGAFVLGRNAEPVVAVEEAALEMKALPGGTFWMGSEDEDTMASSDEKPRHRVTIAAFSMAKCPITRQLYRDMMEKTPKAWEKHEHDNRLPATHVTWFDAIHFCNALSAHEGLQSCYQAQGETVTCDWSADGYRLPTEAEWEYAVRARTDTHWFFGDVPDQLEDYAWFEKNSKQQLQPVGEKKPNALELHDLLGNVWEWSWDGYGHYSPESVENPTGANDRSNRVLRGGSFRDSAHVVRSADRGIGDPLGQFVDVGFRCVRVPRRQH